MGNMDSVVRPRCVEERVICGRLRKSRDEYRQGGHVQLPTEGVERRRSRPSGRWSPAGRRPRVVSSFAIARRTGCDAARLRRHASAAPPAAFTSSTVIRPSVRFPQRGQIHAEVLRQLPNSGGRGDPPQPPVPPGLPRRPPRRRSPAGHPPGSRRRPRRAVVTMRPANGEGISTVAFAVSTSTSGWFSATASPSATSQATISPSSSPSPRSGIANTRSAISRSPSFAPPRRSARRSGR